MSTGFQYIFNNAAVIEFDKQPITAQTQSRNGTLRTTSRGGSNWRFKVQFAAGKEWSTSVRPALDSIESKGRHTSDSVSLNTSGHSWIFGYRGESSDITNWTVDTISGNTCVLATTGSHSPSTGEKLLGAGDLIQLGPTGKVYSVVSDVTQPSSGTRTITVHRPILESDATYTLTIGPSVSFKLFCTKFPEMRLFDYDLCTFTSAVEFVEDMT